MNISFNVPDQYVTDIVSAVRWKLDRPDLSDFQLVNKYLKQAIAKLLDEHKRFVAIGEEEELLATLTNQNTNIINQMVAIQENLYNKKRKYEETATNTDLGD